MFYMETKSPNNEVYFLADHLYMYVYTEMMEARVQFQFYNVGTSGWDLHIPREKWLNYLQTVETLFRCLVLQHLIWVCTVCQLPFYGSPDYNGLNLLKLQGKSFTRWHYEIFFLFYTENRIRHFLHIVSLLYCTQTKKL